RPNRSSLKSPSSTRPILRPIVMSAPIEQDEHASEAAATDAPLLAVEDLSKSFGAVHALRDVTLSLQRREIRAVCGENGAGKSTFVKLLIGLAQPDAGTIRLDGRPVRIQNSRQ